MASASGRDADVPGSIPVRDVLEFKNTHQLSRPEETDNVEHIRCDCHLIDLNQKIKRCAPGPQLSRPEETGHGEQNRYECHLIDLN